MAKKKPVEPAAKKEPAQSSAKNEPAKKEAAKKHATSSSAAATDSPRIDTDLAANAAAALIAGKVGPQGGGGAKKESAAFKQLKAGLNKPSANTLGGIFGTQQQQKKSHQPFGGGKQIGHNQTTGSDATRTGVPRRTPG